MARRAMMTVRRWASVMLTAALIATVLWWRLCPAEAITPVPAAIQQDYVASGRWKPDCPVGWNRLRRVQVPFQDVAGHVQQGELIVLDTVAQAVVELFAALAAHHFPLQTVAVTIPEVRKDDPTLSATTSYFCRPIRNSTSGVFSLHAYGVALDFNARENPFVGPKDPDAGLVEVIPKSGLAFLNRANQRPGMIEPVVDLVRSFGFSVWGGSWNRPIDYMHFEVPSAVTQLLVTLPPEQASQLFALHRQFPEALKKFPRGVEQDALVALAQRAPKNFLAALSPMFPTAAELEPVALIERVRQGMEP